MYGTRSANQAHNQDQSAMTQCVDLGTVERQRQRGGVHVVPRQQTEGGIVLDVGAMARSECALDDLLGNDPGKGLLAGSEGSSRDREAVARSRYEAGMKLRRLFVKAGLVAVKAFDPNARGGGDDLSDTQAQARRSYNDLLRKLGQWGEIAAGPCCFDANPDNERWRSNVRRALDRLCEVVL